MIYVLRLAKKVKETVGTKRLMYIGSLDLNNLGTFKLFNNSILIFIFFCSSIVIMLF